MRYHLHSSNFFHSLSMAHAKLWFIRPWNLERVCAVYIHFWNYFCHYFNFYMNFFIDNSICGTVIWIFAKEKHFAINAQRFRHENRIHSTNIVVRVFFYCFSHSHHHHIISPKLTLLCKFFLLFLWISNYFFAGFCFVYKIHDSNIADGGWTKAYCSLSQCSTLYTQSNQWCVTLNAQKLRVYLRHRCFFIIHFGFSGFNRKPKLEKIVW